MSDINREQLSAFKKRLQEANRSKSPVYSLEEVISNAYGDIEQSRQRKIPWEDIAQMLYDSAGKKWSAETVKRTFFKVQKALKDGTDQPQTAPRPKAQASTRKPKTHPKPEAEVQDTAQASAQVSAQAIAPGDQPAPPSNSAHEPTTEQTLTASHFADFESFQPDSQNASPQSDSSVGEWIESDFNVNGVRPQAQDIAV